MLTMSPLTRYLSRLLGVFLLVTVVSEWTQPGLLTVVFPALFDQPGLLWVYVMLTFASGLAVVLGHNVSGSLNAGPLSAAAPGLCITPPCFSRLYPAVQSGRI